MISYAYPESVKFSDIKEFLTLIGLEPVDPGSISRLEISPQGVTLVRYVRGESGSKIIGADGAPGVVRVEIPIEWSA